MSGDRLVRVSIQERFERRIVRPFRGIRIAVNGFASAQVLGQRSHIMTLSAKRPSIAISVEQRPHDPGSGSRHQYDPGIVCKASAVDGMRCSGRALQAGVVVRVIRARAGLTALRK